MPTSSHVLRVACGGNPNDENEVVPRPAGRGAAAGHGRRRGRPGVPGHRARDRSSIRARPRCLARRSPSATRKPAKWRRPRRTTQGNYTVPFLRPGLYSVTVEMSGFQKYTADGHAARGEPGRRHQRAARGRRLTESVNVSAEAPLLETQQREPRHGHRQRPHRRTAAAVAQPDGARRPRRRRQLQRAGDLPPSVRQRRARRLVDERRPEPQQRVPARRRAQQRQPGRQQHRLRAAGRGGAGVQGLDQHVRRAVRPHGRRRRQHVAEVGHEQLPRRRLRFHAPQGPGRQLVPPQLAQRTQDRSVHRSVRVQRRWSDLEEQDVLPVHGREVPRRHAGAAEFRRRRRRR